VANTTHTAAELAAAVAGYERLIGVVLGQTAAAWWIDRRTSTATQMLREAR
jgi:Na+/glutamate symporter